MAGRPRKLNKKLEEQILEYIADGLTIRQVFEKPDINYNWSSFRKELINSEELMIKYNQAKQLAIDLELSSLKDKRLELEAKIESGEIDAKAGQNLVNLLNLLLHLLNGQPVRLHPKSLEKLQKLYQLSLIIVNLCQYLGQNLELIMNIYFAKPSVSIDFINVVVKRTHIKSKQYIQGVAKIPECCKIITQLIRKILNW